MIAAGIDWGARNTKSTIIKDREIIGKGIILTGINQKKAAEESLTYAIQAAGIARDDIHRIGGTGTGKIAMKNQERSVKI